VRNRYSCAKVVKKLFAGTAAIDRLLFDWQVRQSDHASTLRVREQALNQAINLTMIPRPTSSS
jgi:hypothetical protein